MSTAITLTLVVALVTVENCPTLSSVLTEVVVKSKVMTLLSHLCSKYHLVSTVFLTCRNHRAVVQGYCEAKSGVVVS